MARDYHGKEGAIPCHILHYDRKLGWYFAVQVMMWNIVTLIWNGEICEQLRRMMTGGFC